jgi:ethanolamine utilization cobalamin adenosyltransferase
VSILTEAALRVQLKDADLDAMREFRVTEDVIVTPSAKAYLMDHRISLIVGDRYVIKAPRRESRGADSFGENRPAVRVGKKASRYPGTDGGKDDAKPEYMTALRGTALVHKNHPIIRLRGKIDSLEARLLETQCDFLRRGLNKAAGDLGDILDFVRGLMRAEVLEEPLPEVSVLGMDARELRARSHNPQKYFGVPHFMPILAEDGEAVLTLNALRTMSREVELSACEAFCGENGVPEREDIVMALNRLSSLFYIMMLRFKAKEYDE